MKKEIILKSVLIFSVIISLFGLLSENYLVFAQDMNKAAQDLAKGSPIKQPSDIFKILAKIVQYTYTIFFIVAVIFILFAAFSFLTARDDPEKIKSARGQIYWAAVAIAIALISIGAAQIIKAFITP